MFTTCFALFNRLTTVVRMDAQIMIPRVGIRMIAFPGRPLGIGWLWLIKRHCRNRCASLYGLCILIVAQLLKRRMTKFRVQWTALEANKPPLVEPRIPGRTYEIV